MTVTSAATVDTILNRVAAEVGLDPVVTSPFESTAKHFVQMRYLLQTAGEELTKFEWEFLNRKHQITTDSSDSGEYDLPAGFSSMINQSGWERSNNVPLFGPLSSQDWTYLLGRDLVSSTIYASFRIAEGKFNIFPQPPPDGLDINFEYISNAWVQDSLTPTMYLTAPVRGTDIVLYDVTLITRMLKAKWLGAKGFDNTEATNDFNLLFDSVMGKDKGAEILSAGGSRRGIPYLDTMRSLPDTGYGS